jgi:hypothetical protein
MIDRAYGLDRLEQLSAELKAEEEEANAGRE